MEGLMLCMTFTFKITEWLHGIYSINFQTVWLRKHSYRHQDYLFSMYLAINTSEYKKSALEPFHFCAARGPATWETKWHMLPKCVRGMEGQQAI